LFSSKTMPDTDAPCASAAVEAAGVNAAATPPAAPRRMSRRVTPGGWCSLVILNPY
jgi:hypothetical protein